jgi:tRNA U55 pseudouridine synthase TruB
MTSLVRTASGYFTLEKSVTLEELSTENVENYLIPTEQLVDLPTIDGVNKHIFFGLAQRTERENGLYKIYDENGFYGIAEVKDGAVKIRTKLC